MSKQLTRDLISFFVWINISPLFAQESYDLPYDPRTFQGEIKEEELGNILKAIDERIAVLRNAGEMLEQGIKGEAFPNLNQPKPTFDDTPEVRKELRLVCQLLDLYRMSNNFRVNSESQWEMFPLGYGKGPHGPLVFDGGYAEAIHAFAYGAEKFGNLKDIIQLGNELNRQGESAKPWADPAFLIRVMFINNNSSFSREMGQRYIDLASYWSARQQILLGRALSIKDKKIREKVFGNLGCSQACCLLNFVVN